MTGFSFTMTNGSTMYWDAPDPESVMLGLEEPDEIECLDIPVDETDV